MTTKKHLDLDGWLDRSPVLIKSRKRPLTLMECQLQFLPLLKRAIRKNQQDFAEAIMQQIAHTGKARKAGLK